MMASPMPTTEPSSALIWGTATLMVTIVSCCSLIGVSIMPLISGPSYKVFITLFTGLAVGSLLGSSIFSLIPQAFGLHLKPDKDYLWKSLIIFFGIYLFYCGERLMRIHFDRKAKQQRQKEQQQQLNNLKKNKSTLDNEKLNDKQSGDNNIQGDVLTALTSGTSSSSSSKDQQSSHKGLMTEISLIKDDDGQQLNNHHHHHHHHNNLNPQEILTKALKGDTRQSSGSVLTKRRPGEIAPVAWMIIIGDGLHNFIDGLTIGAAFSQSILFGVRTSVAVIFEEFPHELGDFAVLISSGMTVRQALGFNFLSACTCYIGMIFGIILGEMTQSASYIFALAGGMFLYISLVDMMGELSAMLEESKSSIRETTRLLLMQNIGILSGIIIIFILSLVDPMI